MQRFNDNSRVCFLGDSITSAGIWIAKIFEYYKNKGISAKFYNLGVAGNTASLEMEYLDSEPFLKDATDVVIMFGMNDIKRENYIGGISDTINRSAIEASKCALEKMVDTFLNQGKNLVLCSSTPHAEDEKVNAALCEISAQMKALAKNAGVSYIDFHKLFSGSLSFLGFGKANPNYPYANG